MATAWAGPQKDSDVLARGDGFVVTRQDVKALAETIPSHLRIPFDEQMRVLVNRKLLVLEAGREDLDKQKSVQIRVNQAAEEALAKIYEKYYLAKNVRVSQDIAESYYLAHLDEFTEPGQIRLARLIVKDEALSHDLYERLGKGADFKELVDKYSTDPARQSEGGEMGWIDPSTRLFPEFKEVVSGLKASQVSQPVERNGYHYIFLVQEIRSEKVKPLDEVRDDLAKKLVNLKKRDALELLTAELRKYYHVETAQGKPGKSGAGKKK
jgi:parvulin-like peptidyl-prolyl isomerase